MMERIVLLLPREMLDAVDEARVTPFGRIARTAWIRLAIEKGLELSCPNARCDFVSHNPETRCPYHGSLVVRSHLSS